MAGVSKITLIGNLGRDPETRYTPNGTMNVQFSMAVTHRWNDQGGQRQERTTWFRVTGWAKTAESMDKLTQEGWLAKGKQIYVSGTLEAREYTDQNGQLRTSLDVRADDFQLLGQRGDAESGPIAPQGGRVTKFPGAGNDDEESGNRDFDEVPF